METSVSGEKVLEDSDLAIPTVGSPMHYQSLLEISLSKSTPIALLARATLAKHLAYWQFHQDSLRANRAPEHIHQMRVATRRMRATLELFRHWLPDDSYLLSDELRWIGSVLGCVRDLDVQSANFSHYASLLEAPLDAIQPLIKSFDERRARSFRELTFALDSSRAKSLLLNLEKIILSEPFTSESSKSAGSKLIVERMRKFRKVIDRLTADSAASKFHRGRIRGKKIRYAVEAFIPVYGKPAERLSKPLAKLQDILGSFQDVEVASDILENVLHLTSDIPPVSILWAGRILQYQSDSKPGYDEFKKVYSVDIDKAWKDLYQKMIK